MTRSHVPVLAGELIDLTAPAPGENVVDCTFGAGGHARLVAERIGPAGTLVCVDRDPAAEERFEELAAEVACAHALPADGLRRGAGAAGRRGLRRGPRASSTSGVSSMQVDTRERGFSYSYDAPLDMRMDPTAGPDARDIVNGLEERRLAKVLRRLRRGAQRARDRARDRPPPRARAAGDHRASWWRRSRPRCPAAVRRRFGGSSPAKRVFQAIRIAVNDELEDLDQALPEAWAILRPGGRLAAISFHSLEDRRVKRFLADRARGCICPPDLPVCALRAHPRGRAAHPPPWRRRPGEVGRQPALGVRAPARRPPRCEGEDG